MTICSCCKFEVKTYEEPNNRRSTFCSEFCEQTTQVEKKAFLALQEGSYGVFPCSDCGGILEGDYSGPKKGWCYQCAQKRQLMQQVLKAVIQNVEAKIEALGDSGMPLSAGLYLVIHDLEAFSKMTPAEISALIKA